LNLPLADDPHVLPALRIRANLVASMVTVNLSDLQRPRQHREGRRRSHKSLLQSSAATTRTPTATIIDGDGIRAEGFHIDMTTVPRRRQQAA
jgi:hypothetical protein